MDNKLSNVRRVNIFDKMDYSATVNKDYFLVYPVMKSGDSFYLVTHDNKPNFDNNLSKIKASGVKIGLIPAEDVQLFYIPKHSSLSLQLDPIITHFMILTMDSWYTELDLKFIDFVSPLGGKKGKYMADYAQNIEFDNQNIFIEGHYWFEFVVTKYVGYMATDM